MKKKILKIVSSILGVCSVCGLSLFSLLYQKKDTQKVSAYNVNDLYHTSWSIPTDFTDNTNKLNFDSVWLYFYRLMPSADYPMKPTRDFISWSYNFDYNISGYVGTDYFEVVRINVQYIWDKALWESEAFTIRVIADTNEHFDMATMGRYGLFSRWTCKASTTSSNPRTYSCTYTNNNFGFIDGTDKSNINFLFFFNTLASFVGGNDYTEESIQISQYEATIADLQEQILSFDAQLSQAKVDSYSEGYNIGLGVGYDNGYSIGYDEGVDSQQQNIQSAYTSGYNEGYNAADNTDSTVATIFSNILLIGMLPVDFFLRILNWEFLGINIASFVSALLSVAATIIVIRVVTGGKNG